MIFIQVLTAMKNKYQLCSFQNWLIFWCLLFFPLHLNNGLGKWGWLAKPCQRIPSSFSHTCPQSCDLSCPQNGFAFDKLLFIDFLPKLGHKELVHTSLSAVAGRTVTVGRRLERRPKSFLSGRDSVGQTAARPFAASADVFIRKAPLSQWGPVGIMRLGVVARHFSPPKPSDQNHSGTASYTENGFNMISLCFFHGCALLALCT